MSETILIGQGREIRPIPRREWEDELAAAPESIRKRLDFMSPDHHAVRNFVVRELPIRGRPIAIDTIARAVGLPLHRATAIVQELQRNLFFLVQQEESAVSWAFPVTVDETSHHLVFSTGERLDAA